MSKKRHGISYWFEQFAQKVTVWTGTTWAFLLALLAILVWSVSRPLFESFDTWQLVINTATTIVTFLMVFLIQRAQNKEALSMQLKLNEILAALEGASNRLINIEDLTEAEIQRLHDRYQQLVKRVRQEGDVCGHHTIEEAARHTQEHPHIGACPPATAPRAGA